MDVEIESQITEIDTLLAPINKISNVQQIRLKNHHLDFNLIAYLRMINQVNYHPKNGQRTKVYLSKITDLQYELEILTLYAKIMAKLKEDKETKGENVSTMEQD